MHRFFFKLERMLGLRFPIPIRWRWELSVGSEIVFWDDYYKTKGEKWGDKYNLKFDPFLEIQPSISRYFPTKKRLRILDVGAGPMTFLGKVFNGERVDIIATDPLAEHYDAILDKYDIRPLVRTMKCQGEELDRLFEESSFDIVLAKNSIDHSYDPVKIILNMIKLTSHAVILIHAENEADNESWYGLHQWNFSCKDGDFIISGKGSSQNFTKNYQHLGKITCYLNPEDQLLYTVILKS